MKSKQKIEAVYESDLEKVLKDLELYDDIVGAKIKCAYCNNPITLDNLLCVFVEKGKLKVSCSRVPCTNSFRNREENAD